jgi:hypothetical protein
LLQQAQHFAVELVAAEALVFDVRALLSVIREFR